MSLNISVLNNTLAMTGRMIQGSLLERLLFRDPSVTVGNCNGGFDAESGQIVTLLPTNCLRDCWRFPEPDCEVPRADILWLVIGTGKDGSFVSQDAIQHFQTQMHTILFAANPQQPNVPVVVDVIAQHSTLQFRFFVTDIAGQVVPQLTVRTWISRSFAATFATGYGWDWVFMGFGNL